MILDLIIDGGTTEFAPGAIISGTVQAESETAWKAKYFDVVAFWRTEGKGNTNEGEGASMSFLYAGSEVPPSISRKFTLKLPLLPLTYHGVIVKIHWSLAVFAKVEGGQEHFHEVPIVVRIPE